MGMKKNKSEKQGAAAVVEKDVKSEQGKRAVITDDRFSKMHSDPRFQKVPRNKSKVVVDSRFSKALSSKSFAKSSAPVDKRGKPNKGDAENSLGRYYSLEEEEETEKKKKKKKTSIDTDEEEEDEEEISGDSSEEEDVDVDMDSDASSSTTDTDDEGSADLDVDDDDEVEVENVPTVEKETHRLAILNMDWTQVKAADLFVMLNTILPKGGQVLSVSVYPSEFGLKRMEEEAIRGPAALFDGKEENKDKDSDAEDDDEIDNEKLRAYERSRLRYYYAVAVCDSVATADYLYKSCDGVEFERSSNILDLRFIPDDMEFKHPPRDQATEAPTGYEGLDFHTRALQHSNVQISWDEDEPHRIKTLKQNFNADQLADIEMKEFLASDESEEEEEEEDVAEDPSERKKKRLEKYRALLTSGAGDDGSDDEEDDEHQDMEVTFHTGLEGVSKKILEKKNQLDTVWEAYLRKKKEKKHKNKSKNDSSEDESDYSGQASEEEPEDFFEEQPPSKKAKKKAGVNESKDAEKEAAGGASAAELALLLADDGEGKNTMKGYKINRKKIKGKKGKKEPVSEDKLPVVNRDDPRFAALRNDPNFALDPTDPQYLRSATYARDMAQRSQSAQDKPMMKDVPVNEPVNDEDEHHKSGSNDKHELSLLVKSVRRKSKELHLPVNESVNDEEDQHLKSENSGSKRKHELSLLVKSVKRKSKKLPLPSHNGTLNRSKRA